MYAVYRFISCYIPLRKFWLLCYVMVSILFCFALFAYVLLYVISFGSIILLCFGILCYIPLYGEIPYKGNRLYRDIPYKGKPLTEGSLVKRFFIHRNSLTRETPCKGKSLTHTYREIIYTWKSFNKGNPLIREIP